MSLWFQISVEPKLPYTGDEPHYLLGALSFLKDWDFNVFNNYQQKDYILIGYPQLSPQVLILHQMRDIRPGVMPTEHGMMFPLLLSPALSIGGVFGVRLFLLATGLFCICLVMLICDFLELPSRAGTLAGSILVLCPTWQMYMTRVYPECVGATFTMLAAILLVRTDKTAREGERRWLPFFAGLISALLPILYLRYICLATGLLGAALTNKTIRSNYRYYLGILISMTFLLICILLFSRDAALGPSFASAGYFSLKGTFDRLWYSWFDSWHGLVVYQPIVLLAWWAALRFCRFKRLVDGDVLAWLVISAACYLIMLGLWIPDPGASLAGRYLCSLLPVFVLLIAQWLSQRDGLNGIRWLWSGILLAIGVGYLVASAVQSVPPMQVFTWYRAIFPTPWGRNGYLQDMWPIPQLSVNITMPEMESMFIAGLFSSKYIGWLSRS